MEMCVSTDLGWALEGELQAPVSLTMSFEDQISLAPFPVQNTKEKSVCGDSVMLLKFSLNYLLKPIAIYSEIGI